MPVLKCHKTTFYSQLDEEMFFTGLKKIAGVKGIEGRGPDLYFSVPSRLSNKTLRELLGLLFRYGISMEQLGQFLTKANQTWFHARDAYWFQKVFASR